MGTCPKVSQRKLQTAQEDFAIHHTIIELRRLIQLGTETRSAVPREQLSPALVLDFTEASSQRLLHLNDSSIVIPERAPNVRQRAVKSHLSARADGNSIPDAFSLPFHISWEATAGIVSIPARYRRKVRRRARRVSEHASFHAPGFRAIRETSRRRLVLEAGLVRDLDRRRLCFLHN